MRPESRTVIHLLLVCQKINEVTTAALKPYGISLQQFNVLRILRGRQGKPANLNDISERMVSRMSNTTRLVDKLLAKGYADRITCPSNRRKIEIRITGDGLAALKSMDEAMRNAEVQLVQELSTDEMAMLNHLLNKF